MTGGSGGIGFAVARLLARDGYDLVVVARDGPRLGEAAGRLTGETGMPVRTLARDLAEPGAVRALFAYLEAEHVAPAIVVNNAGFGLGGPFAATDLHRELSMIQVNITALTEMTKLALAGMLQRGSGRILNVASTAAFLPGPLMAVYYATKAYVLSFSQAVAYELRGTGVTVTTLCPGPTATAFEKTAGVSGSRLFRHGVQGPDAVARAAYDGLMRGKRVVIPGVRNRLLMQSLRLAPRGAALAIARWLQE